MGYKQLEDSLLEALTDPISSVQRPKYYVIIKYSLLIYLICHIAFLGIVLPSEYEELEKINHHDWLHVLFIVNTIYCVIISLFGLFAVLREHFHYLAVFSMAMLINVILLIYAASLHKVSVFSKLIIKTIYD